MGHGHGHSINQNSLNKAFLIGIGLNLIFTILEFVYGFMSNSLALISDASHNLSDVGSLILSLIGFRLMQKATTKLYTYGYKKASVIASLINSILLIIVVIGILREAIERIGNTPDVEGFGIIIVAAIGVLINAISAFLFFKDQKKDINIKGAFIHLLVDALVSVGVVISGIVIYYTGYNIIDPIISIIIAIVIVITTWSLLKESLRLSIDAVPKSINYKEIETLIKNTDKVKGVHHIHIWAISSTLNSLTAHILIDKSDIHYIDKIKEDIKDVLHHNNIEHSTLEFEIEECNVVNC